MFLHDGLSTEAAEREGHGRILEEMGGVEQFLNDPWLIKARVNATVQVMVSKVVVTPAPPLPLPKFRAVGVGSGDGNKWGEEELATASAQLKCGVAEADSVKDTAGEEQAMLIPKIMCRLCFSGEHEGSEKASKMLSCNSCGKKYHCSCLKAWSQNRDLFHWSSWKCPSCQICEVCRRTGGPNKFMFCKRCKGHTIVTVNSLPKQSQFGDW
ncbi:PHD finger family protein [Forsythia ovata]|uniref:PHD finger family protein n=1 Tax=Forsythia ovata TaxID=205694 RepID=A0ABD1WHQ3_9LAMI